MSSRCATIIGFQPFTHQDGYTARRTRRWNCGDSEQCEKGTQSRLFGIRRLSVKNQAANLLNPFWQRIVTGLLIVLIVFL